MKFKLISIVMFAAISFSGVAQAKDVVITVKGMVCGFCAQGIEKKFHAESSVDKVKVDLGQKLVSLSLKEGKELPDETIKTLLSQAGYNVEKIERK